MDNEQKRTALDLVSILGGREMTRLESDIFHFIIDLMRTSKDDSGVSIDALNLSTRARRLCNRLHVYSVKELVAVPDEVILAERNSGQRTLHEIRTKTAMYEESKNGTN
jgi:DNA-directed RNA polymerase alpha subunit